MRSFALKMGPMGPCSWFKDENMGFRPLKNLLVVMGRGRGFETPHWPYKVDL